MNIDKKIFIGSDHAGFRLKEIIKDYLLKEHLNIEDISSPKFDPQDDYPDYAIKVAEKVVKNNGLGILICNSGVGMCITANKVKGIRAVNAFNIDIAKNSRIHNDTNVLCLGQDFVKPELAKRIVKTWLETDFSNEPRHRRRIEKIADFEK